MTTASQSYRLLNLLCLAVIAALAVYFFRYVDARALNVPFHDDILDILDFSMRFADTEGWWNSLILLHEQHNDHRTAASRLVYLGAHQAIGEINFRWLVLLANSALVLLLIGFYSQVRGHAAKWPLLLIACLLLMQPRAYALLTFPMAAFAFFYLYAYSFLALICLHSERWSAFWLAIVLAFGANFSIASGQFTWVFGLLVLLYAGWRKQDYDRRKIALWMLFSVLSIALFHYGLETPNDIITILKAFFETPLHQTHFFLIMVGSVTGFESVTMSTVMGVIWLLLLLALTLRDWRNGLEPLHWYAWFVVASIAILALGRAIYVNVDYALAPRYSFASMNLVVCLFFLTLRNFEPRQMLPMLAGIALATVVCVGNYSIYTPVYDDYKERRLKRYNKNNHWIFGYPAKQTNAIVQRAVDRGFYNPPPQPLQ